MKIARFKYQNKITYGIVCGDRVQFVQGSIFSKFKISNKIIKLSKVKLLAPVVPSKIVCVGLNYKDHAKELKMAMPKDPILFLKPPSSVIGHNQNIIYPKTSKRVDYEAELAIVIKKTCKNINKQNAKKYILGYTCLNDVTARDIQKKDRQWTRAKSFDSFCPIGPCISTVVNPDNLSVKLFLNNKLRQSSNTGNFIFKTDFIVSFISKIMTLKSGDVIATGTPPGIGPMKQKDIVEVRIEGIGSLINLVK